MWPFLNHSLRLVLLAGPSFMQVHLYNLQFYKASKNNFLVNFEMFLLNGLGAKTILWMTHFFAPFVLLFSTKDRNDHCKLRVPLWTLGHTNMGILYTAEDVDCWPGLLILSVALASSLGFGLWFSACFSVYVRLLSLDKELQRGATAFVGIKLPRTEQSHKYITKSQNSSDLNYKERWHLLQNTPIIFIFYDLFWVLSYNQMCC